MTTGNEQGNKCAVRASPARRPSRPRLRLAGLCLTGQRSSTDARPKAPALSRCRHWVRRKERNAALLPRRCWTTRSFQRRNDRSGHTGSAPRPPGSGERTGSLVSTLLSAGLAAPGVSSRSPRGFRRRLRDTLAGLAMTLGESLIRAGRRDAKVRVERQRDRRLGRRVDSTPGRRDAEVDRDGRRWARLHQGLREKCCPGKVPGHVDNAERRATWDPWRGRCWAGRRCCRNFGISHGTELGGVYLSVPEVRARGPGTPWSTPTEDPEQGLPRLVW